MIETGEPTSRAFPVGKTIGLIVLVPFAMLVSAFAIGIVCAIFHLSINAVFEASAGGGVGTIALYLEIFLVLVLLVPPLAGRPWHDLGLAPPSLRAYLTIVAGASATLFIKLGYVIINPNAVHHVQSGFSGFRPAGIDAVLLSVLALVIVAPIVEEMFFRGLILNAFERWFGRSWAVIGSSLLFGVAHGDLIALPVLAGLGAVNALVYRRTGNLVAAMIVHASNNAFFVFGHAVR